MKDFLAQASGWLLLTLMSATFVAIIGFTLKMYYILFLLGWHLV